MRNPIPATRKPRQRPAPRQRGAGLLEILIAVLVLSIGFLGMSALLARSLVNNNSAIAYTQNSLAAYSIFDTLRANRDAAIAGNYNTTATYKLNGASASCSLSPSLSGRPSTEVQAWCLGGSGSTPSGLAALGNGAKGQINCSATGECTVTLTFDDSRATGGSATQTYSTKAML